MPAQHGHSEACCNIPPVVAEGYVPKGTYITINGIKTCGFTLSRTYRRGSNPSIRRDRAI